MTTAESQRPPVVTQMLMSHLKRHPQQAQGAFLQTEAEQQLLFRSAAPSGPRDPSSSPPAASSAMAPFSVPPGRALPPYFQAVLTPQMYFGGSTAAYPFAAAAGQYAYNQQAAMQLMAASQMPLQGGSYMLDASQHPHAYTYPYQFQQSGPLPQKTVVRRPSNASSEGDGAPVVSSVRAGNSEPAKRKLREASVKAESETRQQESLEDENDSSSKSDGDEDEEGRKNRKRRRFFYHGSFPSFETEHLDKADRKKMNEIVYEAVDNEGNISKKLSRRVYKALLGKSIVNHMDRTYPCSVWLAYYRQKYVLSPTSDQMYDDFKRKCFPHGMGMKKTGMASNREAAVILKAIRDSLREQFELIGVRTPEYTKYRKIAEENEQKVNEYLKRGTIFALRYLKEKLGYDFKLNG